MIKYRVVYFKFDEVRFAAVLRAMKPDELAMIAEMLELSQGAVWHWLNPRVETGYAHPRMSNFIAVCNLLDLDPRDFFIIEEK